MPNFSKLHPVRHSAEAMFDLVADVERYPEFVPLCESLTIEQTRERDGKTVLVARMEVGYRSIKQGFTSQVLLDRPALVIRVNYLDGPFRHLANDWRFEPTGPESCNVHFEIDYEFRSRTLGMVMGAMFDQAFRRFTAAFEARADALAGRRSALPKDPAAAG